MAKTWEQITSILNEAKFKFPRGQKEVKKSTEKVVGKTLDVRYGEYKRGKIYVYIDGRSMGDPYRDMKAADKEMKNIKSEWNTSDSKYEEFNKTSRGSRARKTRVTYTLEGKKITMNEKGKKIRTKK